MGVKFTIYYNLVLKDCPKEHIEFFKEWEESEGEDMEGGINYPHGWEPDDMMYIHGMVYGGFSMESELKKRLAQMKEYIVTGSVWGWSDISMISNESVRHYLGDEEKPAKISFIIEGEGHPRRMVEMGCMLDEDEIALLIKITDDLPADAMMFDILKQFWTEVKR